MSPSAEGAVSHLWIVGSGRLGLALGALLLEADAVERLTFGGRRPERPAHPVFESRRAEYRVGTHPPEGPLDGVLIIVPDSALGSVAARLAGSGAASETPFLHVSGAYGSEVLAPLGAAGHPVGSMHPLAAVADPVEGIERLRGAWYALEGDERALTLADRLVAGIGGRPLRLAPGSKPIYHAAAVFASNFNVALLSIGQRLLESAGIEQEVAREMLCDVATGAVANVRRAGPAAALTGPLVRGDLPTVRLHLERLSGPDRLLYSLLALRALGLAVEQGLDADAAGAIANLLHGVES